MEYGESFVVWREWITWQQIAPRLGDWKFGIGLIFFSITINLNWIRNLVAQALAFLINLVINLILLALRFLRILVDIIAAVIAILLAPVVLPIWYLWGMLKDAELFRLSTQGQGELNLLDLLWTAGASTWEKQLHEALWEAVENVYSIVPAAKKRIPSIKRMLRRTLFTLALQHLGVGMLLETLRTYLSNIIKWIDNQWHALFEDQRSVFQQLLSDLNKNLADFIESEVHKVKNYIDYQIKRVQDPLNSFQRDLENIEEKGINWKEFLPYGMVSSRLGRLILDLYNGSLVVHRTVDEIWKGLLKPEDYITDKQRKIIAMTERNQMIVSEVKRVQDPDSPQSKFITTEVEYWERV